MKRLFTYFIVCLSVLVWSATLTVQATGPDPKDGRRQMKAIRDDLKELKAHEALRRVENLRKDSLYAWNPQLLNYATEAYHILNDGENEKLYLRTNPDTVAFFATLYNMFDYALLTDSVECTIAAEQGSDEHQFRYRFRRQNTELLARRFGNLVAASRYFSVRGKWDEVERYAGLVARTLISPISESARRPLTTDSTMLQVMAMQHANAAFRLGHYNEIERYAPYALGDTVSAEDLFEQLTFAAVETGRDSIYTQRLEAGHRRWPANMFFFSRLIDHYLRAGNNDAVLASANSTLSCVLTQAQDAVGICVIDSLGDYAQPTDADALEGVRRAVALPAHAIAQIFEARTIAFHNAGNPRACIKEAKNILRWSPTHQRAEFYIGASYYRLAERVAIPSLVTDPEYRTATRERGRLLGLGRPHLEAYRRLCPEDSANWAPLLYETYLYLNLGPEFEEISRYVE